MCSCAMAVWVHAPLIATGHDALSATTMAKESAQDYCAWNWDLVCDDDAGYARAGAAQMVGADSNIGRIGETYNPNHSFRPTEGR
jgi:hypothetical protein